MAIYDLRNNQDLKSFELYSEKLKSDGGCIVELKKKQNKTVRQNSYLHLILSWFAIEYGETVDYVKSEIYKKICNSDLFVYKRTNLKTGELRDDLKSINDLDSAQITTSIDRFRDFSSKEAGIYLAQPNEKEILDYYFVQSQRMKQYL